MQKADLNNPSDRKKLVIAAILGIVAIVFLWWTFIGFGSSGSRGPQRQASAAPPIGPNSRIAPTDASRAQTVPEIKGDVLTQLQPIVYEPGDIVVPEPSRNIFSYYEPPPKPAAGSSAIPSPTPTPPVLVSAINPANVYARTTDFTLELSGDKFSPQLRVFLDDRELPTRYIGAQQLSANVPAALISMPGQRQVIVRSANGKLYSNVIALNVSPPPTPNYSYVGIIGNKHYIDIALVQDRGNNKDILNVQRGDVLGGRFRVTSISEKELVLTDTNLKIKHTLPMTNEGERGGGPVARPTPKVDAEDDEP